MKAAFTYFLVLICCTFVKGQTVSSSCTAPDSIKRIFAKSADKLAVRRVEYIGDTYKDSTSINRPVSYQYLKSLLAVYNATALPARDTIMALPIVLDFRIPHDLNSIFFTADSSQAWMKNLKNNIIPCGNTKIDSMIARYYLKKLNYTDFAGVYPYHAVAFRADSNYYINRLCDRFNSFMPLGFGFLTAFPANENQSDSYNITDSINANFTDLTYSLGWGGCMIPCVYRRYWKFRINNDCTVAYLGSYGNTLPWNVFTGIKKNESDGINVLIYPNPVDETLHIELGTFDISGTAIHLVDLLGKTVYSIQKPNVVEEIPFRNFSSGVYFLRVVNSSGLKVVKVLK